MTKMNCHFEIDIVNEKSCLIVIPNTISFPIVSVIPNLIGNPLRNKVRAR
ncbi:MAG: hypothetical protein PHE89_06035 [Alphaproteobacteria bacterium]|nr:hypothetical protein [Alphaproteobacteria bacterium]